MATITFPRLFTNLTTALPSYLDENFAAINAAIDSASGIAGLDANQRLNKSAVTVWDGIGARTASPNPDPNTLVVRDAGGAISAIAGTLIGIQVKTSGTVYTPTTGTNSIIVELFGGGGPGGSGDGSSSAGGGGGSGGYALKRFTGISGTYNYVIAEGSGSTQFTGPGPVVVTASGGLAGSAGSAGVAVAGGSGAAVSANGDINCGGNPGSPGNAYAQLIAGNGGVTRLGGGGKGAVASGAGTSGLANTGSGGGGGVSSGGGGGTGLIIIYEYR